MNASSVAGADAPPRASRLDRAVPWIAGAVVALPVLIARYPPMADLPAHEAVVGLLRHWGDPRFIPPDVYTLSLGQPNQLLYFFILPLAYVVSTATATKLAVVATLLLLPVGAARFADHLRATRWTALLVAPLGLGWMFFWGLLANLMALAGYLFALPSIDRFVQAPTARRAGVVAAWLVLLHFIHDLMALAAGLTLVVLTACAPKGWRANLARLAPAALVALLALFSRALESRIAGGSTEQVMTIAPLVYRLRTLPGALFAGEAWMSAAVLAIAVVPMLLFATDRWSAAGGAAAPRGRRAWDFRFEITAAVFVALYFVAPMNIDWTTQIYQRFLSIAFCLLAVSLASHGRRGGPRLLPAIVTCLAPLAPVLLLWPELAVADRAYRALDEIIARMEPGSSYVILELGPSDDPLFSPAISGGHIVAALGGRTLFDYTQSPAAPVVERARWDEIFQRLNRQTYGFVPSHDLRRFRYVILHTTDPSLGELVRQSLEPDAQTRLREGEFTLLESTLPRVPLDAPDDPFTGPRGPTLDERALSFAKGKGILPAAK